MKRKNNIWGLIFILTCILIFSIPTANSSAQDAEQLPTSTPSPETTDQIEQAILEAIAVSDRYQQGKMVANLQVSDIHTSHDLQWGTAWVIYYDYQVEALIPTEPGLVVTRFMNTDWQVYLPPDTGWQQAVFSVPEDLLTTDEKNMYVAMNQGTQETESTQTGYYLPWHGGQTANLSRSVGHDADFTTAHFSFDFYMPGQTICPTGNIPNAGTEGLNFNIHASKAGTVAGWEDSVENCNHSAVNFILLRNIDDPSIYQLYLHVAQGSIPPALKSVGAPVARGQFIAIADNTGASSGSHLHFQVEHQPYWPADNPYWSTALDVTFNDVAINGGRPRVSPLDPPYCRDDDICDVFMQTYVSNNYYMGDSEPPTGVLSGVTTGETVTRQTLNLSGWGSDSQSGLDHGQLRAFFDGSWHNLGTEFNPSFTYTWDLCTPSLPVEDGAVSLAMALYDNAGNPAPLVGLSTFIKDYACPIPPPACIPGPDQVSLFEDPYYEGGCVKFGIGDYPMGNSLNPLGNDDAESILVGGNVIATLYSEENYSGHSQAIQTDHAFINYDWVDNDSISSMKVAARSGIPQVPQPNPLGASVFREGDVIPLAWLNKGGAVDYQVEIYRNSTLLMTIPWQAEPVKAVEALLQGDYKWRVQGRNASGASAWSAYSTFSIVSPIEPPSIKTVPYSDTMETTQASWTRDGLWLYLNNITMAHSGTHSWWYQNSLGNYDNNQPNSGSLTSPPFSIPITGNYYLRFYYRYETETIGNTWDQRWVQISVDGEPFHNITQFSEDPLLAETIIWLKNKAIDLSAYKGHVIQVRFQFETWDASANNFTGWGIDDFSITTTAPDTCDDIRDDDSWEKAFLLNYDPAITVPGQICPNGDVDYYKFYGEAGDRIAVDIDAMINDSLLDGYLYLLDSDGKTVIAENDDEIYAELRDPLLGFTLDESGIFYLKFRAWKHPLAGGKDYFYTIRIYEDHSKPQASITWPPSNTYLPDAVMNVTATVSDETNGVNRVEFYWHSPDWTTGDWDLIGTDRQGSDGWSVSFDPDGQPEGNNAVFFIKAYDMAGNLTSAGAWNLGIDKTAPITEMQPLETTQSSNAFLLEWTSTDNLSGLDYLEIQQSLNGGNWTTLPPLDGLAKKLWIISTPGNAYAYRMHGVDYSGNSESYPSTLEASTSVPGAGVLCNHPDVFDSAGKDDNSPANANLIIADGASQVHNFCNPRSPDFQNDEDWIKLTAIGGKQYFIHSHADSMQTAGMLSLYAEDGTTLIGESTPAEFGKSTILMWTPDHDQTVYIRSRHLDGRVIGSAVSSTIRVSTGSLSYVPLINK